MQYSGVTQPHTICRTRSLGQDPLDDKTGCIDIEDPSRARPSDDQVWQMIREIASVTNATAFQQLADEI